MAGRIVTLDISAVGLQFRLKRDVRDILAGKSFKVALEREPDNRFDDNAIKVLMDDPKKYGLIRGQHIGYIRRETAAELAPRVDEGKVELLSGVMSGVDAETGSADLTIKIRKTA